MADIHTFLLLIAPDPQRDGHFVAHAPDLPGWTAHGTTRPEAAERGSEIVRALARVRTEEGEDFPAPTVYGVAVPVPRRPAAESVTEPGPVAKPEPLPAAVRAFNSIPAGSRARPFGDGDPWGRGGDGAGEGGDQFEEAFDAAAGA